MQGFPAGSTRKINKKSDGTIEQTIACHTDEAVAMWEQIFPRNATAPVIVLPAENVLLLGPKMHRIDFQSVVERDQWRQTFMLHPSMEQYARWIGPRTLVIGSSPRKGVIAPPGTEQAGDISALTDAQLRTRLAELGNPAKKETARAVLLEMLKSALELEAQTAPA